MKHARYGDAVCRASDVEDGPDGGNRDAASSASVRSRKKRQRPNCDAAKTRSTQNSRFETVLNACGQMARGRT